MVAINTTTLEATGYKSGVCKIEFSEIGYKIVNDDRDIKVGYLHITEISADIITDGCRNQIINYMFNHPNDLPGVGKTVIDKYFTGLSKADCELIGNGGKSGFYS